MTHARANGLVSYDTALSEAKAAMPMRIVPVRSDGTAFQPIRDGKPVPGAAITVISPNKWSKTLKAGADGTVTVPMREKGRYLLSASVKDEGDLSIPRGQVAILHCIAAFTFSVD